VLPQAPWKVAATTGEKWKRDKQNVLEPMAKQQKIDVVEAIDIEAHPLWKDEEDVLDF